MPKKLTIFSLVLIAMLLLSGCFKSAGSDRPDSEPVVVIGNVTTIQSTQPNIEETPEVTESAAEVTVAPTVATVVASPTTPVASATTSVPASPSPTASPTSSPTITQTVGGQPLATSSPVSSGQGGALTAPSQEVAVLPTSTATATATATSTNTATATNTPTATNTTVPTETATPVPPTSTPTSAFTSTPTAQITSTTVGLVEVPSFTPTSTQDTAVVPAVPATEVAQAAEQVAPAQATATQIIMNATSTAAAQQTVAAGGQLPPAVVTTPIPGVTTQPGIQPTVAVATTAPGATPTCQQTYMVQIGDTLSQIARTFGRTITELANANSITNPDLIRAGYPLIIPCPAPATPVPAATLPTTGQGGVIATPGIASATSNATGPFTYTVLAGDNIYRLSLRFGVTMLAILSANPQITDMNVIAEGQQIIIPGPPTVTPQTSTTTGTTTLPVATAPVIPTAQVIQPTQQFQPLFTPTFTPATTG